MTVNAPKGSRVRNRAMAAGFGAIALWGALATLSVLAGPVPPFQMVAMTFTLGAAIGILRARLRGVGWRELKGGEVERVIAEQAADAEQPHARRPVHQLAPGEAAQSGA